MGREGGGAGVWKAGLDRARMGLQGGRTGDGAADRRHRWETWLPGNTAGRAQACSPVFAVLDGGLAKAGPLQKRGIPASICAGGEDAVLWGIKGRVVSQKTKVFYWQVHKTCSPSPFHHKQSGWEKNGVRFYPVGQGFLQ